MVEVAPGPGRILRGRGFVGDGLLVGPELATRLDVDGRRAEIIGTLTNADDVALVAAIVWVLVPWLRWRTTEYTVTNKRIAKRSGILTRTGRLVPARKSVANSPVFLDPTQPPASAQVFLDAIPHLRRTPNIAVWHEIETRAEAPVEPLRVAARTAPPQTPPAVGAGGSANAAGAVASVAAWALLTVVLTSMPSPRGRSASCCAWSAASGSG